MSTCQQCGNEYDKCIKIILNAEECIFDCFECAIQALAPVCINCNCKIIGHGMEYNNQIFCCAHCAKACNVNGFKDRLYS